MSTTSKQPEIAHNPFTSCKECIFAVWDNITQTGCEVGFELNDNPDVLSVYDEEKEFFVLKNKTCPYFRKSNWKHCNDNDRINLARSELCMNYEAVIVAGNGDIEVTMTNLMEQSKRPSKIFILIPNPDIKFDRNKISECLVPWTIETRTVDESKQQDRNHLRNILRKVKSPLIVYLHAGTVLNTDTFKHIENKIIDDGFEFGMITISSTEFIIPKVCYDYFNYMSLPTIKSIMQLEHQEGIYDICKLP